MKRCTSCLREYADDLQFCTECGTLLADMPSSSNPQDRTIRIGDEYETRRMPLQPRELVDEMEMEFLKMVCSFDQISSEEIAMSHQLNLQRVRFHRERMVELDLIEPFWNADGTASFGLTHKGRGYLIQKGLL